MLELVQVDADDVRLDRLLQLYMHEWSALVPTTIGADARFDYRHLPAYVDRARHGAYLIVDGAAPIGCALVAQDDDGCWHVEEFFVIAGARRHGAGAAAARRLFAIHPGPWSFTVRPENAGALAFWRRVVPEAAAAVEVGADGVARTRLRLSAG
ncbi:MAG: GNAT family N-acetyltransferase [Myxococcales bacterium]|nr:GNAT family N-acetyltransferase [Myxococcales bacterium]